MPPFKVLLIDDDDAFKDSFKRVLNRLDLKTTTTSTDDAGAFVSSGSPDFDLVILDMNLASKRLDDQRGLDFFERLRTQGGDRSPELIFFSAFAVRAEDSAALNRLGAKVFDKGTLRSSSPAVLDRILGSATPLERLEALL